MKSFTRYRYYGFSRGHNYLTTSQLLLIESLIGKSDSNIVEMFESQFAQFMGDGSCIAFAAGRMAFYSIMKALNISQGDEVILLGSNCSVMVNAVLRIGANPIFSDIDAATLGSSSEAIEKVLTHKTKMIVAQHSFGIPCHIKPIVELAAKKNIPLVEDCALSYGSKYQGVPLGNFGIASIFSTDRTKPINTFLGGLAYSKDKILLQKLREIQVASPEISIDMKKSIFFRLKMERRYCTSGHIGKYLIYEILETLLVKWFGYACPYFSKDFCPNYAKHDNYPAKMPSFLAQLGLFELENWNITRDFRIRLLKNIIKIIDESGKNISIPQAYRDLRLEIVPLRIVWAEAQDSPLRGAIENFVSSREFWFKKPIIATNVDLGEWGYAWGSCPLSEDFGNKTINLPVTMGEDEVSIFLNLFSKAINITR